MLSECNMILSGNGGVIAVAGFVTLVMAVFVFCSGGVGTITVTTTPIPATVSVNGVPYGVSPVTMTLNAGTYEISFARHTNQYESPPPQSVRIEAGGTVKITGIYRERLIDRDPGGEFVLADSIRFYGTRERPLRDGTIFDYINGGALVYLDHGLRETAHARYRNPTGDELVVDIFDMGSRENAEAAIRDEEICPAGFEPCGIGAGCRTYSYPPDFLMYFQKDRYLVFLSTTGDSLANQVKEYAAAIAAKIE